MGGAFAACQPIGTEALFQMKPSIRVAMDCRPLADGGVQGLNVGFQTAS